MARRQRTPEGAWYWGYAGMKPYNPFAYSEDRQPLPNTDTNNNNYYDKNHGGSHHHHHHYYNPHLSPPPPPPSPPGRARADAVLYTNPYYVDKRQEVAAFDTFADKGDNDRRVKENPSSMAHPSYYYKKPDHHPSYHNPWHHHGGGEEEEGGGGGGEGRRSSREDDGRRERGGGGGDDTHFTFITDAKQQLQQQRNSNNVDFKLHGSRSSPRPIPEDFKLYDPAAAPKNGPTSWDVHKPREPFSPPPPRHDSPRNRFHHHDHHDHHNADDDADDRAQGRERERERELELYSPRGRLSPRKGVAPLHYEPSFQDPGASPRKKTLPPWEREYREELGAGGGGGGCGGLGYAGYGPVDGGQLGEERGGGGGGRPQVKVLDPMMTGVVSGPKQVSSRKTGSAFLFIRYRGDCHAVVGQACQAARTRDLRGQYIGIADKVYDFGDIHGKNRCGYAVFQLPSLENAELFYNYDKVIRQPDFPRPYGDTEVFAINLQTDPGIVKDYRTFLLSEVTLNDGPGEASMREYHMRFMEPFYRLLLKHEALSYAAFCDRSSRKSFKRRYFGPHDFITLHLFRDFQHFELVRNDPEYTHLRSIHNAMAEEKCSIFTVRPTFL
ncbi:uncharacterized protein LOC143300460 [Babylonia areolata]|uniref:uncharacterized protein LOC143300460 n=1 Tax=Babylonia areolata TaxID=304850 RepID=UPI003FD5B87C